MPHIEPSPDTVTQANLAPPKFACELRAEGRAAAWIHLVGELDLASAPQFTQALEHALERALLVIVDLRELAFMDCTGIHAITEADSRARRGGRRLVLVRGPAQIERLFELVGLTSRLEIIGPMPGFAPSPALAAAELSEVA